MERHLLTVSRHAAPLTGAQGAGGRVDDTPAAQKARPRRDFYTHKRPLPKSAPAIRPNVNGIALATPAPTRPSFSGGVLVSHPLSYPSPTADSQAPQFPEGSSSFFAPRPPSCSTGEGGREGGVSRGGLQVCKVLGIAETRQGGGGGGGGGGREGGGARGGLGVGGVGGRGGKRKGGGGGGGEKKERGKKKGGL